MTFEIGKTYRDTVGRKWKIVKWRIIGNGYRVYLVRRWFRTEIAVEDTSDSATVLIDYGFSSIYAWGD